MSEGETLREICRDEEMPARTTVAGWVLDDRDGISVQFARARELGLQAMADETLEIADDGTNDWVERTRRDGSKETALDREHVLRSTLRVSQRNWLLARLARHVYGDNKPKDADPDGEKAITIKGGLPD
jgi:hypothetical protein